MAQVIKPLEGPGIKPPPFWTMFLDATDPPAFSYSRIVGFLVIVLFLTLTGYLSVTTGALVMPSKEWVYILVSFSLMKPLQRYSESKDNEAQLNYEFQMAQLKLAALNPTDGSPEYPPPYYPPPCPPQYPPPYRPPYQPHPQIPPYQQPQPQMPSFPPQVPPYQPQPQMPPDPYQSQVPPFPPPQVPLPDPNSGQVVVMP